MAQKSEILFKSGDRGYSVLKMLRQDMFDQVWNKLPDSLKTPEMAQQMADGINHVTGVTKGKSPEKARIWPFSLRALKHPAPHGFSAIRIAQPKPQPTGKTRHRQNELSPQSKSRKRRGFLAP